MSQKYAALSEQLILVTKNVARAQSAINDTFTKISAHINDIKELIVQQFVCNQSCSGTSKQQSDQLLLTSVEERKKVNSVAAASINQKPPVAKVKLVPYDREAAKKKIDGTMDSVCEFEKLGINPPPPPAYSSCCQTAQRIIIKG